VHVLEQKPYVTSLFTKLRDEKTPPSEFAFYANLVIRLVVEFSLDFAPTRPLASPCYGQQRTVLTPTA
jgi:uracil phosphoribosyltransferase